MRRAITLVEALVAVVLIVAVMIPVLGLMSTSTQQMVQSQRALVALQLAQALIETWPVAPETIALTDGRVADPAALAPELADVVRAGRYAMQVEIEEGVGGHAALTRVETRLDWDEGPRRVSRTFARLVCR